MSRRSARRARTCPQLRVGPCKAGLNRVWCRQGIAGSVIEPITNAPPEVIREDPYRDRREPRHGTLGDAVGAPRTHSTQPRLLHDILGELAIAVAPPRHDAIKIVERLAVDSSNVRFGCAMGHQPPMSFPTRKTHEASKPTHAGPKPCAFVDRSSDVRAPTLRLDVRVELGLSLDGCELTS